MFKFNFILCAVLFTNLILIQSLVYGFTRTFSSCNDFKLANGRMRIKPKGRLAKFQCNRGYMLAGDKYSYCVKGKFDVPPPICVKPTCIKIKQLTNGMILPSYNGAVVNFYCKPGFTMRGSNISYCDGSRWSHNLPACLSTHMPTPTSCDFETEDLCGWSHDLNHDFDWRRQNFQTPSGHIGTGPKHDHTKGNNQDGYYIYIESTSRLENDTARLISPLYTSYPNGLCFTFWYHMFGRDMGQLRIYLRTASQALGTKPLWTKQGNHGDVWRSGKVVLEEGVSEEFQIIIEGVRGKSYVSDIAVDDVALSESCPDDEQIDYTSTTDSTDEDSDVNFGSCINKCNDNTEIILSDSASCECNESCYERNTCCPDYTIVCLIAALEETSTDFFDTDSTTEMIETEATTIIALITSIPIENVTKQENNMRTTRETRLQTTTTTEPVMTTTSTIKPIIINETNNVTKNNTNTESEKTAVITTTPFSIHVTTKPTTTNRPIIITTKPTKRTTQKTIITTKPTKPLTKIDKNNNNIDKITSTTPKIITSTSSTKNKTIVPKIIETTSTSTTTTTTTKPIPTELVSIKIPVVFTEPNDPFSEYTTVKSPPLEIETDYESTNAPPKMQMVTQNDKIVQDGESNLTLVIFCTSAVVVIGIIVAVVLFAKYNTSCSRLRFRNSRNSDSMSDVRFLASDEVLDFTWRTSADM